MKSGVNDGNMKLYGVCEGRGVLASLEGEGGITQDYGGNGIHPLAGVFLQVREGIKQYYEGNGIPPKLSYSRAVLASLGDGRYKQQRCSCLMGECG